MRQFPIFRTSLTTGLCWGIIGGLFLIMMTRLSHNVLIGLLPYVGFLVLSVLTVQLKSERKIQKLFLTGLITFMLMSFVFYLFLLFEINPDAQRIPFIGHVWRMGAMLFIGSAASGLLTFLVTRRL